MAAEASLLLALCQLNPTVGDIDGNRRLIEAALTEAREAGATLALAPELAITGYPPEDLLLKPHFLEDAAAALGALAAASQGITAVVGFPERAPEGVYNSAAVLAGGRVHAIYRKVHLPNYGVFDEQRYFRAGNGGATVSLDDTVLGLTVCEDIWLPGPPTSSEAAAGAQIVLNISASPYHAGKGAEREQMLAERARENGCFVAFCGLVGGQDELLFDGHSCVVSPHGETIARAAQFRPETLFCEIDAARSRPPRAAAGDVVALPAIAVGSEASGRAPGGPLTAELAPREAEVYRALCLGLHDYVEKNGFRHVALGLSGGIDSALVACLARDALGADRVSAVVMPSPYSTGATQGDARELASRLGVDLRELSIAAVMDAYNAALGAQFEGSEPDITEENLQARIRGNLLMALSNKFGWLVLTTGNKSEMSVGYTTLYGDLAGGFAVIKDVPKTLVYALCRWRNGPDAAELLDSVPGPIPASIIERAPSAELRPDQRDIDSLPPYDLLDRILEGYVELDRSAEQLVAEGLDPAAVAQTIRLVDLAEYKRRQAPPGIKITPRAFGRDRRMPITNAYRG